MAFKNFWQNLRGTANQYLQTTTIHGLRYLSDCKQILEKSVWLLIVGFAFFYASFLIYTNITETQKDPILTTLETSSIEHVPFPAITIRGSRQANPWGFVEKTFNMLTFYGPTNSKVIEQSKLLREDARFIMEKIISKFDEAINEKRSNWTLEDFKSYPSHANAPNLLLGLSKTIKTLTTTLAGISIKDEKIANKIEEEIKYLLVDAFFENVSFKMNTFLKVTVNSLLENYTKNVDYSNEITTCQNEENICMIKLLKYYNLMYLPFEVNKFPYETLGLGTYVAYFSRLLSSPRSNVRFFNAHETTKWEKILRDFMAQILWLLADGHDMAQMSTFELVKLLHQNPNENLGDKLSFANPLQKDFGCIEKAIVEKYLKAWDVFTNNKGDILPCKNTTISKEYLGCCNMSNVIQDKLPTILKVMKYSIQPVLFRESLEDFLKVFNSLDFMIYNNVTNFADLRNNLMEINFNPRVYMCQYAGRPATMQPEYCDLFYTSLTNEGIGYSFNKANFWDIFSKTPYNKLYAKIMRPKGFDLAPSPLDFDEDDEHQRWVYPANNISFPDTSGPAYGLQVSRNYHILY